MAKDKPSAEPAADPGDPAKPAGPAKPDPLAALLRAMGIPAASIGPLLEAIGPKDRKSVEELLGPEGETTQPAVFAMEVLVNQATVAHRKRVRGQAIKGK